MWVCEKCQTVNVSKEPRCRLCGAVPGEEPEQKPAGIVLPVEEVPLQKQQPVEGPAVTESVSVIKESLFRTEIPYQEPIAVAEAEAPPLVEIPEPTPVLVDIPDNLIFGGRTEEGKTFTVPETPPTGNRGSEEARIPELQVDRRPAKVDEIGKTAPAYVTFHNRTATQSHTVPSGRQPQVDEIGKTAPAYVTFQNMIAPQSPTVPAGRQPQVEEIGKTAPAQATFRNQISPQQTATPVYRDTGFTDMSYKSSVPAGGESSPRQYTADTYSATEPSVSVMRGNHGEMPPPSGGRKKKTGLIAGIAALIAIAALALGFFLMRVTHTEVVLDNVACTLDESVRLGKVIQTDFYDQNGNKATEVIVEGDTITATVPDKVGNGSTVYTVSDGAVVEIRKVSGAGTATSSTSYVNGNRVEADLDRNGEIAHSETYDKKGTLLSEQNLLDDGTIQYLHYDNELLTSETVTDRNGKRLYEVSYVYSGKTLVEKNRYENDQLVLEETYNDDGVLSKAVHYENGKQTLIERYDADGELEHSEETVYDANGNISKTITYDAWVSCYFTDEYYYSGSWGWPISKPLTSISNCSSFYIACRYTKVDSRQLGKHLVFVRINNSWTKIGELEISAQDTIYYFEYKLDKPAKIDALVLRPANATAYSFSMQLGFGDVVCESSS